MIELWEVPIIELHDLTKASNVLLQSLIKGQVQVRTNTLFIILNNDHELSL